MTIQAYKTETVIKKNHKLEIDNLPFEDGDKVEVLVSKKVNSKGKNHLMIGEPIIYINPFEPVAEDDWDVLK